MKNILYLHAGAELYGADIVLLELLKNLDKDKYNPHVVLPCKGPLVDKLEENNISVEVLEYPIIRRKYFTPVGIISYIKNYFKYSKLLKQIAKERKIDIIHTNTSAVLESIYLKRKLKISNIWHVHEILLKPAIVSKAINRLIAKYSDEVITVSEATKANLMKTGYFNEVKVIYNGVDNNVFNSENKTEYLYEELNIPNEAKVVGMIGRVNAWKGQKDFLKALNLVLKENKDVYAVLIGGVFEGEEWRFKELEEVINNMENKDRIRLINYRSDSKNIHCFYDIFVLPSTNPDPLPTVVLESMASATPIVGYKHGGVCEMVKENYNGLFAEVGNTEDLSNKILELINDEEKIKEFSKNSAKRQRDNFSLKAYVKNFSDIYEEIK